MHYTINKLLTFEKEKLGEKIFSVNLLTGKIIRRMGNFFSKCLVKAAIHGDYHAVKAMISVKCINVNRTHFETTALCSATKTGSIKVVKILLKHEHIDLNKAGSDGANPLLIAIVKGHTRLVELLLETGESDINKAMLQDGITPLIAAALFGFHEIVDMLLCQSGISVNKVTYKGCSALFAAAQRGHKEVVKRLLSNAEANINCANILGETPLYIAASNGHANVVNILLRYPQLQVNIQDSQGLTPLSAAVFEGQDICVELLLHHNDIDVNITAEDGTTPLIIAAQRCYNGILKELMNKAGIHVMNGFMIGRSALDWAAHLRNGEGVEILLRRQEYQNIHWRGWRPYRRICHPKKTKRLVH